MIRGNMPNPPGYIDVVEKNNIELQKYINATEIDTENYKYGVRIEDTLLITKSGRVSLTNSEKKYVIILM